MKIYDEVTLEEMDSYDPESVLFGCLGGFGFTF